MTAQVMAIAASPLLTRIYQPRDFGALQIFISVLGLAVVAAAGRYEVAVLLPEDDQSAIDILALAVLCVCISTMVTIGLVVVCHYRWILPVSMLVLKDSLWLLPISVLGAGLYQALSYWAMRRDRYAQIAATKLTQSGVQVMTQLGAGFVTHSTFGLLLGDSLGRVMGSGRFLRDLWVEDAGFAILVPSPILWFSANRLVCSGKPRSRCSGSVHWFEYFAGLYVRGRKACPIRSQTPLIYFPKNHPQNGLSRASPLRFIYYYCSLAISSYLWT